MSPPAQRLLVLLLAAALTLAAATGCSSLARQGRDALALGPKNESVHRDLIYARHGATELKLTLHVPDSPEPAPVVMWLHGGFWKYGSKEFNFHLRDLTRQGFAVATVQYRKIGQAPWPAALDDARTGFNWLQSHAARYNLNPNQMFLAGESAGGHLAALLAASLGRPQVRALCLLYAPTDMKALWKKYEGFSPSHQLFIDFFGRDETEARRLADQASPVARARRTMPPTLIYHGDRDWIVPLAQSQALDSRLRQLGVTTRLVVVDGQNHAFPLTSSQLEEVAGFFRSQL